MQTGVVGVILITSVLARNAIDELAPPLGPLGPSGARPRPAGVDDRVGLVIDRSVPGHAGRLGRSSAGASSLAQLTTNHRPEGGHMRKHHTLGAILAASALVAGGGLAGASGDTTVPGTEPAGTEPAGTEPAGTEPAGTEPRHRAGISRPGGRSRRVRDWSRVQLGPVAQVHRHRRVRPGQRGRPGGRRRAGRDPCRVPRPDRRQQRRRADRDHDQRRNPGRQRRDAVEQRRRPDRSRRPVGRRRRRRRRDVGLADPDRRRRERVRRPGRLRRDRPGDGRHVPLDPR